MKTKVIGLGAGGHAKGVVEILNSSSRFILVGLLDPLRYKRGESVLGVPVLGDDSRMIELRSKGVQHFVMGVGSVGNSALRRRLYESSLALGFDPVNAIHPSAVISKASQRGRGLIVMAGGIVNAATLGDNVLVNTGAVIEHDCVVGHHTHLASGSVICGGVEVGEGSFIGAGAIVRQGIRVGKNVVIGAGSVVVSNVPDRMVVAGVPAKRLRSSTNA